MLLVLSAPYRLCGYVKRTYGDGSLNTPTFDDMRPFYARAIEDRMEGVQHSSEDDCNEDEEYREALAAMVGIERKDSGTEPTTPIERGAMACVGTSGQRAVSL